MKTSARARIAVVLATGALLGAAPHTAASTDRLRLIGPEGNFHCGDGTILSGEPQGFGFVVLRHRHNQASALIRLQRGEPDTVYFARLIQVSGDQEDCHFGEVAFRTDRRGHATVRLEERLDEDTLGLNVSVNTEFTFGFPSYVGEATIPLS